MELHKYLEQPVSSARQITVPEKDYEVIGGLMFDKDKDKEEKKKPLEYSRNGSWTEKS